MYDFILNNISKNVTISKDEEKIFTSKLVYEVYEKKDFIFQPGKAVLHTYFVSEGCLKLYEYDDNAVENVIAFVPEDYWNSDLYSFLTGEPATQYLQATEKTKLFKLSKLDLNELYVQAPSFERFFRILHQNSHLAFINRIRNKTLTAEEKYDKFIEKFPRLELRVKQKDIASYIGITPEFLSKIKKKKNRNISRYKKTI